MPPLPAKYHPITNAIREQYGYIVQLIALLLEVMKGHVIIISIVIGSFDCAESNGYLKVLTLLLGKKGRGRGVIEPQIFFGHSKRALEF